MSERPRLAQIVTVPLTADAFLPVQLPAFRATTSPTTSGVTIGAGGARTVDLRGLGAQRSLVLVDGRRFVPSTIAGAVDTNRA